MFNDLQRQFLTFWQKQSRSQKIVMVSLLLALAVLVPVLIGWATQPSYSVAYNSLSEEDAASVVKKLQELNISYQIKNGTTILVEANKVYDVRLQMASAGLPKNSAVGYELFSGNTLGMNEFTQKVNYQRALEGELSRTISSLEGVAAVSVHVVTPEKSLLSTDQSPATASVTIQEKSGMQLSKAQVRSITHLVASSVEGMKPENVVVVDGQGNMLASGSTEDASAGLAQTDSQRAAESAAADEVRRRVQTMLDQILGPNRSNVQASVALDWTKYEKTSNSFAATPVVRSSQKVNEQYNTNGLPNGGIPGASTNLPTPVPVATGTPGGTIYSRTEETMNYEVGQVQSKETLDPGQIKRVSVSVMVDNITDAATIASLKTAVTAAAGIDAQRGDQVVVESIAFDRTYYNQQTADLAQSSQTDLIVRLALTAAAALAVGLVVFFFTRMIGKLRKASKEAWRPIMQPVGQVALNAGVMGMGMPHGLEAPASAGMAGLPTGQSMGMGMGTGMPMMSQPQRTPEQDVFVDLSSRFNQKVSQEDEQRSQMINKLAEENPATVAEIIQIWLSGDEKRNG